jgi:hypothetical protein
MAYKIVLCKRTASPKPKEIHASKRAASMLRERLNVTRCLADKDVVAIVQLLILITLQMIAVDPPKKSKRRTGEEPGTSHMVVACILE